jgi:hypothetical protein
VLRSRRIVVDPMTTLNAKPMPIVRNAPEKAVVQGSTAYRRERRRARRAARFDAQRHMDGATQHLVRAGAGHVRGALTALFQRGGQDVVWDRASNLPVWRSPCVDRCEVIAATQSQ